jgi:hypothetical protein
MNPTVAEKQVAEAEAKLVVLLSEIQQGNADVFARVQLWVARMCQGRKLADYIHDAAVPVNDRATVAQLLVHILLTKAYDRLPEQSTNPADRETPPKNPAEPCRSAPQASEDARQEDVSAPFTEAQREAIRTEVQRELATVLETIAKALRA